MLPVLALFSLFTLVALGAFYFHPEKQPFFIFVVDHIIWAVFAVDFCVRLCFAKSFRDFIAAHISEFVAIIPVFPFIMINYAFELLNWDDTSSLLIQLIFFIKFLAYLGRAYTTQSRFFKTNLLHYAGGVTMVSASLLSGALFSDAEEDDEDEELLEDCTTEGRCWLTTTPLEPELEITWLRLFSAVSLKLFTVK